MKTYIYKVDHISDTKGNNRVITVYRIKQNKPVYLGSEHVNTAAYRGDYGTACDLIHQHEREPMENGRLVNSMNMRIVEV